MSVKPLAIGAAVLALPALALAVVLVAGSRVHGPELETPFAHRESKWQGSDACRSCHPDHYASWHRTFHRTMTQEATAEAVVGAFDGREVTYWGVRARPIERDGRYFIQYLDATTGAPAKELEIVRTVGSRRYQQYLVQNPDDRSQNYYRIPLLWHIGEQRWIHLNGAFLGHDNHSYDRHLAIWNQNCIFCHNTGPQPGSLNYDELIQRKRRGENVSWEYDQRFDSSVAELGISCESCHAPSETHASRNRNPLRRYLLHASDRPDPTVVNPAKLDKERSVGVCGQCHGQRLASPAASIKSWMHEGPPYRAGEELTASVQPVRQDTRGPSRDPDLFRLRFWGDGTPRLSAYEYQGITTSPCFLEGELTCISCHDMHGGDVNGQIRPEMRTNEACRDCHPDLVDDVEAHSHHAADGPGASCYACHMPRMVYGILEIHRSHKIESPDPARDIEAGRPNACTNCHLDRTPAWAAEAMREWWGDAYRAPTHRGDGAPLELVDLAAALMAGDPVQRAVAAEAAGALAAPLDASQSAFLWPLLIGGLGDEYPAIRWFSRRSLLERAERDPVTGVSELVERFDYIADPPVRRAALQEIQERWRAYVASETTRLPIPPAGALVTRDYELDPLATAKMLRLRSGKRISIGE